MKKIFKNKTAIWLVTVAVAFMLGFLLGGGTSSVDEHAGHDNAESPSGQSENWTCSMHPQIQQPGPGQCPICGMDLIPVSRESDGEIGYREIKLSQSARKLADVQTATVERKDVASEKRLVGKIAYDETRLGTIAVRVPGRIEKLYVDFTGTEVKKGDKLFDLYSPELVSTQKELIESLRLFEQIADSSQVLYQTARQTMTAVRERLRLWGFNSDQIAQIESSKIGTENLTIYAPQSGTVTHKNAVEGTYVKTGENIYTIADLSRVWILLDAYESDLSVLRLGQDVEFQTEAWPGQYFKGTVTFIDPLLNQQTRSVKVRLEAQNRTGLLKPEMFVRAQVKTAVSISEKNELVIPVSAALITGKRAVVYVADPENEGVFEGREVVLGSRAGNYYVVKKGLSEGEEVVVNGAFKIDSAIQIQAKPSMMNPQGGKSSTGHEHHAGQKMGGPMVEYEEKEIEKIPQKFDAIPTMFLNQLDKVFAAYFTIQNGLSSDDLSTARKGSDELITALKKVNMKLLRGDAHMAWMDQLNLIKSTNEEISQSKKIDDARLVFENLSSALINTARQFGTSGNQAVLVYHCPMAFNNKGADWLQNKEGTENPYFGSAMFKCGSKIEDLSKN